MFTRHNLWIRSDKSSVISLSSCAYHFCLSLCLFNFVLRKPLVECMLEVSVHRNVNFLIDGEVIPDRRDNSQLRFIERDQKRNIKPALGCKYRLPADASTSCGNCKNLQFYISAFVLNMRRRNLRYNFIFRFSLSVCN